MSKLRYAYDHFEELLSSLFLVIMIGALSFQVAVRAVTGGAVAWAEEVSRFAFVWAVYIGASLAAKKAAHVCINAQLLWLPVRVRLGFRMLADFIWCGFNIFFVIHGIEMVRDAFAYPEISPTLGFAKAWIEIIIPVAFAFMTWRTVELYLRNRHNLTALVTTGEGQA
ncbi:MAG: TRAP transporter small permease [Planctomycetes bacterium]|nr:TRAP transporter small permease [Planctomycetota bacterium]